jgi:Uri superfamily endonuclease
MGITNKIPSASGTYILILELNQIARLQVGKLGERSFPAGLYAYVGSAQGSGGLAGRVGRHLRTPDRKRSHWHIDVLITLTEIVQIWWKEGSPSRECLWARDIALDGAGSIPGFGSTDCRCPSHLFFFKDLQEVTNLQKTMKGRYEIEVECISVPYIASF